MSHSKSIVAAGADPGSVAFGFAVVRFLGLLELVDENGASKTVPHIEPLVMQRWNMKEGQVFTHDAQWHPVTHNVVESRGDRLCDYAPVIGCFVGAVPELFEHHDSTVWGDGTLPLVVTENQFDHIKSAYAKCEMLVLSHAFRAAIESCDAKSQLGQRINMQAGLKYGIRNDNSLPRPERKKKADAVTRELFVELGLTQWTQWLDRCDAAKEQTHDMCDALLLAIQEAMNRYGQLQRDEIKQRRALIKAIPKTPTVKRAKKAPASDTAAKGMARTKSDAKAFFAEIEAAEQAGQDPTIVKASPKKARAKTPKPKAKKARVLKEADKPPPKPVAKKTSSKAGKDKKDKKEKKREKVKLLLTEAPESKKRKRESKADEATEAKSARPRLEQESVKLDLSLGEEAM